MSTKVASAMRYRISNQMRCGKQEKACKFIIFSITQRAGHEYIDGTCKDSIYSFFFFFFSFFIMREKLDMAEIEHSTDMKLLILTKFKPKYDEKLFLVKIVIVYHR